MIRKLRECFYLIKKIGDVLNRRLKVIGVLVLIMTFFNALMQMLGVSIIVPVVSMMTSPEEVMGSKYAKMICDKLAISSASGFFTFICTSVIVLYLVKNAFCVFQLWVSTKYSCMVQRNLATTVLEAYMARDYDFFLNYGTTQILRDVQTDTYGVNRIITYGINLITEVLTTVLIVAYIVIADWAMALCLMAMAFLCIIVIYSCFKNLLRNAGQESRMKAAETQKVLLEAIEGIKEVQAMRKQPFFLAEFEKTYLAQQKPEIVQRVLSTSPTYLIEAFFVSGMMLFISVRMIIDPEYVKAIPLLASFLVGAVRLLPALGRISSNLAGFTYNVPSLNSVHDNMVVLKKEKRTISATSDAFTNENNKYELTNSLVIRNVCWHYNDTDNDVLSSMNLTIEKGKSIGIIGQSGSGKSTLADIILGLHIPQSGEVLIDGINIASMPDTYSRMVGYVPQSVYLIDGSIRENVAFGENKENVDDEAVWEALRRAKLEQFIKESRDGLDTIVGERGVRFSGGQRQRLAIARAIYRNPQILVMDEATSALDNDTEGAVIEAIEGLHGSITMIIIAHRLTTVRNCDEIFEINGGKAIKRIKEDVFS